MPCKCRDTVFCAQLAHKFNVKMALDHCDAYLAKRAADNPGFLQMGTVRNSFQPLSPPAVVMTEARRPWRLAGVSTR